MNIKKQELEKKTIRIMTEIFCRGNHSTRKELCEDCSNLLEYSLARIDGCLYEANKPVCADCPIHCYRKDMREKIRSVMRYSGPRMIFYHPFLTIRHILRKKNKSK